MIIWRVMNGKRLSGEQKMCALEQCVKSSVCRGVGDDNFDTKLVELNLINDVIGRYFRLLYGRLKALLLATPSVNVLTGVKVNAKELRPHYFT